MIQFFRITCAAIAMAATACAAVDVPLVKKIETYLNGIKTYKARIIQTNNNGSVQKGWFYMERGGKKKFGKMRIQYDAPIKDLMVVDGRNFIFYDAQAKEENTYDIDSTPAAFLLRRKIDLHDDLRIVESQQQGDELGVKVIRAGDESGAALILKFSTAPFFKLNGWAVIDPQGLMTRVHLEDVTIGMPLDESLFKIKN